MNKPLKALVVDDEVLARRELMALLADYPEIEVVGEANSVPAAIEAVSRQQPEVIFLDIQMPGKTGFELLKEIEGEIKIIFVTAYDQFAIRAFEVNALDYLLKPVLPERLAETIKRLWEDAAKTGRWENQLPVQELAYDDHLFLTIDKQPGFLKISDIKCLCVAGEYTEIITGGGKKVLLHQSLKSWEKRLPSKYFVRIHRSTIVNIEWIAKVEEWFNYAYHVYLRGTAQPFHMSRRYARKLKEKLK